MRQRNRYLIQARDKNHLLTLDEDQQWQEQTARPLEFKQPRIAAFFWRNHRKNIANQLSSNTPVWIEGPRGGQYNISSGVRL